MKKSLILFREELEVFVTIGYISNVRIILWDEKGLDFRELCSIFCIEFGCCLTKAPHCLISSSVHVRLLVLHNIPKWLWNIDP